MRKILIFLLFILSFQSAHSQVWVDNGATWHYEFWQPFMSGYVEIIYDRDSLIDGVSCQVLESTEYKFFDGGGYAGSNSLPIEITYVSGDTVFYRDNEEFFVLFNFGAEIGDSWKISDASSAEFESCADSSMIQVTGVGMHEIDGEFYRYIDLEPTTNSPFGFKGRFVERFGLVSSGLEQFRHLFPQEYDCEGIPDDFPTEFGYSGFVCFEDDSFSLYNPTSNSCTKAVGISEIARTSGISCYPNPASSFIEIKASSQIDFVRVYGSAGDLVMIKWSSQNSTALDISLLVPGIYLFDINLNNGTIEKRNIVVN